MASSLTLSLRSGWPFLLLEMGKEKGNWMFRTPASTEITELLPWSQFQTRNVLFTLWSFSFEPIQATDGWVSASCTSDSRQNGSQSPLLHLWVETPPRRSSNWQRAQQWPRGELTFQPLSGSNPDPMVLPPQGHTHWKPVFRVSGFDGLFRAGQAKEGRIHRE